MDILLHEDPADRARWEPCPRCAEPRPDTERRVLDEVITFVQEAKVENGQVDRALGGMGHRPDGHNSPLDRFHHVVWDSSWPATMLTMSSTSFEKGSSLQLVEAWEDVNGILLQKFFHSATS